MAEMRPPKFRGDTGDRLAARVVAMDALGAWNPVPDDKLTRLLSIADQLRGVVGYAPLVDSVFDAVLAVLTHQAPDGKPDVLIEPLLAIWGQALDQIREAAAQNEPPPARSGRHRQAEDDGLTRPLDTPGLPAGPLPLRRRGGS